jgi:glycosyltransferase involved in cell wall biosynthesis
MNTRSEPVLSVVVPVYNEAASLPRFLASLRAVLTSLDVAYEIIFVDDGSLDASARLITEFCAHDHHARLLKLTRNFGKEIATTAGIHVANGDAILMLDADGQHPVNAIPQFVNKWQCGAMVVVGKRSGRKASLVKRIRSKLFYGLFHLVAGVELDANASDFRLIDKRVQIEFNRMSERNRITRGLVDWLGYEREYVVYQENPRLAGNAAQSFRKLCKLAIDSAISLSISPLYITAYIGAVVLPLATLLGLGMLLNWGLHDPLHLHATGSAYLNVLVLWLIGVLLVSQGIIGLYLSHIHTETQNRPLYIVDEENSKGFAA